MEPEEGGKFIKSVCRHFLEAMKSFSLGCSMVTSNLDTLSCTSTPNSSTDKYDGIFTDLAKSHTCKLSKFYTCKIPLLHNRTLAKFRTCKILFHHARCWKQCSHGGNTWCETGEWSFKEPKQIGARDCAQISQSCKTSCYDNWTELDALNPLKPTDNGCEGEYPVDDEWLIPKLYCENGTYWGSHRGR